MLKPKKLLKGDTGPYTEFQMSALSENRRKFNLDRQDRDSYLPKDVIAMQKESRKRKEMIPSLPTKKAETLKTSADKPKEIIQKGTPLKPVKKSYLQKEKERLNKNVQGLKDLVGKAADKANSRYKKVEKTGIGGRIVTKEKGLFTRTVDGKEQLVREKRKTVSKKTGTITNTNASPLQKAMGVDKTPIITTKKTVVKGKGVKGSVIGRYKDVKRFKK